MNKWIWAFLFLWGGSTIVVLSWGITKKLIGG